MMLKKDIFKKTISILLLIVFCLISTALGACKHSEVPDNDFIDDGYLAQLDGSEDVISILTDSGNTIGAGYADITIQNYSKTLDRTTVLTKKDGVYQYYLTKEVYNYNVDNNNIRLNFLDWGWEDKLAQKTTSSFLAGYGVDVLIGETQMPSYARQGALQPFPEELAQWIRENMLPSSYKAMEVDGKIYGVSYSGSPQILLWNKKILRECGISENIIENGPSTWNEWVSVCSQVKAKGGRMYYGGGIYAGNALGGAMRVYPFIEMNKGALADENVAPAFNKAENAEVLEMVRSLSATNKSPYILAATAETVFYDYFFSGKIAYITGASYMIGQSYDRDITEIGWCRLPAKNADDERMTNMIASIYLGVPVYCTKSENAFKVIKSFLVESTQKIVAKYDLKPVSNIAVGESEEYKDNIQYFAYNILKNDNICYMPSFPQKATDMWNYFTQVLSKSATTAENIQSLLNSAQNSAVILLGS